MPGSEPRHLSGADFSILEKCIHCGMCLPACPTYTATQNENSSPRGRIAMMKAVADERIEVTPHVAEELSFCLGCLACQTACPADVDYAHLLELGRADVEASGVVATPRRTLVRGLLLNRLFPSRRRLRALGRVLWFMDRSGLQGFARRTGLTRQLAPRLAALEPVAPTIRLPFTRMGYETPDRTDGPRVALIAGCVQDIAFADVNRDTVAVLEHLGCRVTIPARQVCCGSLLAHNGELDTARTLARRNLDAIPPDTIDAIISNAAGCGSHVKHYHRLLADDPAYRDKAAAWDAKVRDALEFIADRVGDQPPPASIPDRPPVLVYQEACHLVHGQKVSAAPRRLLQSLPTHTWKNLPNATRCCGSAGIYNITQPRQADAMGRDKADDILAAGADVVAAANPGCLTQLQASLRARQACTRVIHPVTLLAEAWCNTTAETKAEP